MEERGGFYKSVTAIVVAASLVALTACNSGDTKKSDASATPSESSTSSSQSAPSSESASPSEDPVVEITAWDLQPADSPIKALKDAQFEAFEKLHPNIKVTHIDNSQSNGREKFLTAVAGGEGPDISEPAFPDMQVYIQKGIAADITDLINSSPEKDRFIDGSFDLATKNGKIYGIPDYMYSTGLLYNKKLFKNAGIDHPPATWEEFATTAQTLQEKNPGTVGFDILGMDWADWHFEYYVWQAGGDLTELQPDGTVKLQFTSEASVKALQYYKDLKWKYKVTQKNVVQDYPENQKDFYTGHSAMILGGSSISDFTGKGMDPNDIGFAPFPVGPSGKAPSQVGGAFYMVNAKSSPEKQKAAFIYAMFFMSKEQQEYFAQFYQDNGLGLNPLTVVKDLDVTKYIKDVPADFVAAVQKAAADPHLEYYLKSSLSSYLVKPIQKILLDPNADPASELQKAQVLAQKEVIDKYNQDVLSGSAQ
ncbi:extracellular solute-binding protein [Cohnella sp. 56]|uniref:extracellular solute-binding protein n=1 Tax=Cohnella sp. 56 TaxID=3113722 RepID=UPI0030E8F66A